MNDKKLGVTIGGSPLPRLGKYTTPVDEKAIGEMLRELRKRRGITQVEIAEKLGIDQSLVSEYERGTVRVHGTMLAAFAKAYHASADEILGLEKPKRNGSTSYRERRFFQRLQKIEELPVRQKQTLLQLIDAFIEGPKRTTSHEGPEESRRTARR